MDFLEYGWQIGVQMESDFWGPDLVLPIEVMTMNAFSKPLRSGNAL